MKKLFPYLFTLFLLAPVALAAELTIKSSFETFVRGFTGAFSRGGVDAGSLVTGLIAILPVVGIVVIVFGLMFFVTKISIFKSPEHDKYARMIAWGVALIGLAQQSVFNAILGLSTSFLILVFILAIVFIFIMFVNYNRKAHLTSHAELHKITGDALGARRDLEKIKHELKHEKALYAKTEQDLEQLDSDLNSMSHLLGNELSQVDKIAQMLRKATAAYQSGNSPATDQYAHALAKDIAGLITTMQHEQNYSNRMSKLVSEIETVLAQWGHGADKDKSEEEHLQKLFHKLSESWGLNIDEKELKDLYKEEKHLIKRLKTMRNHLHNLQSFYDRLIGDTESLEKASYQRKHLEASAVRDNILNKQFAEAHKHLDNLRAIIEYEPHVIKKFKNHEQELRHLVSKIHEEEKELNALIKGDVFKKLTKLRAKATEKNKATGTLFSSLHNVVTKASEDLKKYHSWATRIVHEEKGNLEFGEQSRKEVYDLPEKLLHRFTELQHQFHDLLEKINADTKDGKKLKAHKDTAIIYLEALERLINPSINTVHHAKSGHNNDRYGEALEAILQLLQESKNELFGSSHSILEKLKKLR